MIWVILPLQPPQCRGPTACEMSLQRTPRMCTTGEPAALVSPCVGHHTPAALHGTLRPSHLQQEPLAQGSSSQTSSSSTVHDRASPCIAMHRCASPCTAVCGRAWPRVAVHPHASPYMAVGHHVLSLVRQWPQEQGRAGSHRVARKKRGNRSGSSGSAQGWGCSVLRNLECSKGNKAEHLLRPL